MRLSLWLAITAFLVTFSAGCGNHGGSGPTGPSGPGGVVLSGPNSVALYGSIPLTVDYDNPSALLTCNSTYGRLSQYYKVTPGSQVTFTGMAPGMGSVTCSVNQGNAQASTNISVVPPSGVAPLAIPTEATRLKRDNGSNGFATARLISLSPAPGSLVYSLIAPCSAERDFNHCFYHVIEICADNYQVGNATLYLSGNPGQFTHQMSSWGLGPGCQTHDYSYQTNSSLVITFPTDDNVRWLDLQITDYTDASGQTPIGFEVISWPVGYSQKPQQ